MTNTTGWMRHTLIIASLVTSAGCATLDSGNAESGDTGDVVDGVLACTRASDCAAGVACDVTAGVCVPGVLTLEPENLVVEPERWWTNTSAPALRGTLGRMAKSVQITVGDRGVVASLDATRWTAELPDGAIGVDSRVVVTMTDTSGGRVELQQTISLDTSPPVLTLAASAVRDERADTIDFSTGEPVHTHAGPDVDLTAAGCPTVARHAYLMGAGSPVLGEQSARNPFVWNLRVTDLRVHSVEFRVRDSEQGTVYLDWTTATPSTPGAYAIELSSDDMPALAAEAGRMALDVRARDWSGSESVGTWCWTNLPLAAPLQIEQATRATGVGALASWSLSTLSPVSNLLGPERGGAIAEQRITQYTAEPIWLQLAVQRPTGRFTRSVVEGRVPVVIHANDDCSVVSYCSNVHLTATAPVTTSGTLESFTTSVQIVDEVTGEDVTARVLDSGVPARVGAPHPYRVRVFLNSVADLRPSPAFDHGEYIVGGVWYTGAQPGVPHLSCNTRYTDTTTGKVYCRKYTRWEWIAALDAATLELDAVTLSAQAAVTATSRAHAITNVPPSLFVVPAWTWDAGDEDLPGPY